MRTKISDYSPTGAEVAEALERLPSGEYDRLRGYLMDVEMRSRGKMYNPQDSRWRKLYHSAKKKWENMIRRMKPGIERIVTNIKIKGSGSKSW